MSVVKLSPKYQIVIPKEFRDELALKPGEKIQVLLYEGRIEIIPVRNIKKLRGFLFGMDTEIKRDKKDRV